MHEIVPVSFVPVPWILGYLETIIVLKTVHIKNMVQMQDELHRVTLPLFPPLLVHIFRFPPLQVHIFRFKLRSICY